MQKEKEILRSFDIQYLILYPQAEKVHELNEEIGKLLAKAEQLGAE